MKKNQTKTKNTSILMRKAPQTAMGTEIYFTQHKTSVGRIIVISHATSIRKSKKFLKKNKKSHLYSIPTISR